MEMRCPRCGSYAHRDDEVPPLRGSATVGSELRIECLDCSLVITNAPRRARESFTGHLRSPEIEAKLNRRSLYYCGLVVAGKSQQTTEAHRGAPD